MAAVPNERDLRREARQDQFLEVIDRDAAEARFVSHLQLKTLGTQIVPLNEALNRVLACEVASGVDVPAFDRANVDGFAVHAADTFGALEEAPRTVTLNHEVLQPGEQPQQAVSAGTATTLATGAMLPRGADAVIMIEHTQLLESEQDDTRAAADRPGDKRVTLEIRHSVAPGQHITFAGTDIAQGETVLRGGQLLTSRDVGVLAAIGCAEVTVFRRPQVAIISTGNEIVSPGTPLRPGAVYDSNAAIVGAAVEELGGVPVPLGAVPDDVQLLRQKLHQALQYDVIILSGGTSKGAGDLSYRVVNELTDPGIVAHGVALKPGKPICLAVTNGKPVVILPGFPTSAIFTFHEFVAPVIQAFGGQPAQSKQTVTATLPMRLNSERGRTEYVLVGLVRSAAGLAAYPMGKGSGSVTTFSFADGFVTIGQHTEILEAGESVTVQLLGQKLSPADLVVVGSHCVGLDVLLGELHQRGLSTKVMHVGSTGGLAAAQRGECDVAGVHLLDENTSVYNRPFLTDEQVLIPGYRRMQGIVFRAGDARFDRKAIPDAIQAALSDPTCRMVNRNAGSGTRILIDRLLTGTQPPGYQVQAKSHNAVAMAVAQGRADWGLAISTVAEMYQLAFIPYSEEHYDFVVPKSRFNRPPVQLLRQVIGEQRVRDCLQRLGFRFDESEES